MVDETCLESDRKDKAREAVAQTLKNVEHDSRKEGTNKRTEEEKKTDNVAERTAVNLIKGRDEMEDGNVDQREMMKNCIRLKENCTTPQKNVHQFFSYIAKLTYPK